MSVTEPKPSGAEVDPGLKADPQQLADSKIESMLGVSLPKLQRLPDEQEIDLLKRIREAPEEERDITAEDVYLRHRARTVYSAVSEIPERNGLTVEDYFQIGLEIVITEARAKDVYDLSNGVTTTYFRQRITPAVNRASSDMRFGDSNYVAAENDTAEEEIATYDEVAYPGQLQPSAATESIDPHEIAEQNARKAAVKEALDKLDERERHIIEMRFGIGNEAGAGRTLDSVGKESGVSRERVRAIIGSSLRKLELVPTIDFTEDAARRAVRDRTPFVITSDPHEQRIVRRLGYPVYGNMVLEILDDLSQGVYHETSMYRQAGFLSGRDARDVVAKNEIVRKITGIRLQNVSPSRTTESFALQVRDMLAEKAKKPADVWSVRRNK